MALISRIRAAWLVSRAAFRLRRRGFQTAAAELLGPPPGRLKRAWGSDLSPLEAFERTAFLPWSTCLSRCVAAASLLRQRGYPAQLRIGTQVQPAFSAHAWITLHDRSWSEGDHHPLQGAGTRDLSPP
ncbi:MAG: lasso peptide biosynthesis B2 protein [Pseudomonadota bacterium]